ncbi:MAG: DUF2207 domain-containing protein [Bacteroidales bacterium]|nr:DUF2207 domain-containing protein [Bacteroidales bacterium]
MKKRILISLLALMAVTPLLRAQQIDSVGVEVYIYPDGSALVSQLWKVEVVSGTEWYMPVRENDGIHIEYLHVVEFVRNPEWSKDAPEGVSPTKRVNYVEEGRNWDTNRSLEEKTYRCGINPTAEGCELCWGQGSMGWHRWLAFFMVKGLVQSLNDYDGFNFMFVNPELVAPPRTATVTLINKTGGPEWTEENILFWGFGYKGSILLEDGKVVARTEESLGTYDKMIVMMRFNKGMLSPENVRDSDFETMRKEALKDSDWNPLELVGGILCFGGIIDLCTGFRIIRFLFSLIAGLFSALIGRIKYWTGHKYDKYVFGSTKVDGYWRDIPLGGDILQAAFVLDKGLIEPLKDRVPSQLMSAYFLRWILEGKVQVITDEKGEATLSFPTETPQLEEKIDSQLYLMALEAAGQNNNRLLESKEFSKWAKGHKSRLGNWCKAAFDKGGQAVKEKGYFQTYIATDKGIPHFKHLAQFENYLKDFTLASEREAPEVGLWKDYLVFAALFGIADRVAEQFRKLYPKDFAQFTSATHLNSGALMATMAFSSDIARRITARPTEPVRRYSSYSSSSSSSHSYYGTSTRSSYSGHGGSSSHRGGGGYSGGGRGGGSR